MGRFTALVLALAGCQMYGGPPAHLRTPEPTKPPPTPVIAATLPQAETCEVDFARPVAKARRTKDAEKLSTAGDQALRRADPADTPERVALVEQSMTDYDRALAADPYYAEATLGLALAYDRVQHKGCALAMLRRLEALTNNSVLRGDAEAAIQRVADNVHWFKEYRREALQAVGK